MIDSTVVIKLNEISKKYKLFDDKKARMKEALHPLKKQYHKDFYALNNINLEVRKGEILGIVGMNGSGKSTLLKIISGIIQPSEGTISVSGHVVPLLELGSGFNPEFTGLENIYFYNSIHGYSRKQTDAILDSILDFAEIGSFVHQPLKTYSSGMKARLAFAVSVNIDPDILILDEVLSVGDELFRRKCYARMEEFFNAGKTILFVSHSAQAINQMCTRTIFLNGGEIILEGPTKMVTAQYERYLFAKKENMAAVKQEIILMNDNKELKEAAYIEIEKIITNSKSQVDDENVRKTAKTENKNQNIEQLYNKGIENITQDNIDESIKKQAVEIAKPKAYFNPDLVSKSRSEYKNYDVLILDVEIHSSENSKVNVLNHGENYYLKYSVKSNICIKNISFGMAILNYKGVVISFTGGLQMRIVENVEAKKNDLFSIKWKFKNLLVPGIYFVNVQVSGDIDGQNSVLNRIRDAITFKVVDSGKLIFGGLVNLEQSLSFSKE